MTQTDPETAVSRTKEGRMPAPDSQPDAPSGPVAYGLLTGIGALAGLCIWLLSEAMLQNSFAPRTLLFASAFAGAFFVLLLAMADKGRLLRAALPSLGAALVLGGAMWWASGRHAGIDSFLQLGYAPLAYGMILLIVTPFLAAQLEQPQGWRDYPTLFWLAWQILVRFAAAALFTALFWGLLSLSDALLRIVGLELLDLITRYDAVVWILSGAVFGLALAVVRELSDYISPYLVLRLMRLFLPLVLIVVVVFLIALPLRGWDGLLTGFSPAGILMAFAVAGVVLVTVTIERAPQDAPRAKPMRVATALLALLLPVLAGLAFWAVWIRIGQYGWTPSRLMALTVAGVLVAYGLAYGLAVLMRGHWMARIREANIWLALACVAVCGLWLTPLVVPERLATADQVARAGRGIPADQLPLDRMLSDWGIYGQAGLGRIAALGPELAQAVETVRSPVAFAQTETVTTGQDLRAQVLAELPVYPQGQALAKDALSGQSDGLLRDWLRLCRDRLPEGPGCALYLGQFTPGDGPVQGLLFLRNARDVVTVRSVILPDGKLVFQGRAGAFGGPDPESGMPDAVLSALHKGEVALVPNDGQSLAIGGSKLFPYN